jgi:hypothetical protein
MLLRLDTVVVVGSGAAMLDIGVVVVVEVVVVVVVRLVVGATGVVVVLLEPERVVVTDATGCLALKVLALLVLTKEKAPGRSALL